MRGRSVVRLICCLGAFTANFILNNDCFSQCSTFSLNPCTTIVSDPCEVKAFGVSAKVVKYQSNPSTFWVRLSAGGFGYIGSPASQRPEINVGVEVNSSSGYTLARKSEPISSCATVFGNCIQAFNVSDGSNMMVTPVATSQIGDPTATGYCRKGPPISITLNASDTAVIDTGMLGSSSCEYPPSDAQSSDLWPSKEKGDPINISSGNVYRNEVDAIINSGKIGAFSFERNYNSLNQELSSFGYGWQHNFNIRVLSGPTLQEGEGRRIRFYDCGTIGLITTYCPLPGITDTLTFSTGNPPTYKLKKRNSTTFNFSTTSDPVVDWIRKITDRNNNEFNFIYNSSTGLLDTIREPGGRTFNLVYNGNNLVQNLKNQAGTILTSYDYYTGTHASHLKRVTYGENSWVEYVYDSLATTIHKIKKIITSDGNEYFYDYDSKGRARASYRTGNVDRIDVTYERRVGTGSNADSLLAVVTDSLGNRDTLLTQPNALATDRLLIKGRNAGCSACADSFQYDDHSNLIYKRSPLGIIDKMEYDNQDRRTKQTEAFGTAICTAPPKSAQV